MGEQEQLEAVVAAYCGARDAQYAIYDEYARRHGLSSKAFFVLRALYDAPEGIAPMEICRRAYASKQTVSAILKGYLHQGYIAFAEQPCDRRSKRVCLTDAGRTYAEAIVPPVAQAENEAMHRLSSAERKALLDIYQRFTADLAGKMEAL